MRYEIRVEGLMMETTLAGAFPELDSVFVPNQTILFGQIVDDAHLYLRRAKSSELLFGPPARQRARLAEMAGI